MISAKWQLALMFLVLWCGMWAWPAGAEEKGQRRDGEASQIPRELQELAKRYEIKLTRENLDQYASLMQSGIEAHQQIKDDPTLSEEQKKKLLAQSAVTTMTQEFEVGKKAYEAQNYASAYFWLTKFRELSTADPDQANADRKAKIKGEVARIHEAMEEAAQKLLQEGEDAVLTREYLKAIESLSRCRAQLWFTRSGKKAGVKLAELVRQPKYAALVLFTEAQKLEQANDLLKAQDKYLLLLEKYPRSVEAIKAGKRLEAFNSEEKLAAELKTQQAAEAERVAPQLLLAADNYNAMIPQVAEGQREALRQLAREKLHTVIAKYPSTPYAEEAQKKLEKLN